MKDNTANKTIVPMETKRSIHEFNNQTSPTINRKTVSTSSSNPLMGQRKSSDGSKKLGNEKEKIEKA